MSETLDQDADRGFQAWVPAIRQWKVGCLVATISFAAACAVLVSIEPVYRAYIQLALPIKLVDDPANRKSTAPAQTDAFVVRSYSDIIKDDGLARVVIRDLKLAGQPEFNPAPTWFSNALESVGKLLRGSMETGSQFSASELANDRVLQDYEGRLKAISESKALTIMLSFDAHDPHLAQTIVTAHAQAFVQSEVDFRRREAAAKVAWMKAELDRTAAEARDSQVALQLNPTSNAFSKDSSANAVSVLKMRQLQATATQAVYDTVLKRYQDLVADQSYEGSEIRILSAASTPTHPNFPKKLLSAAVAALISAILGVLASAIASLVKQRVDVATLASSCGVPLLGHVNVPGRAFGQLGRLRRVFFWHQIHTIRSTVAVTGRRHPVIVVTSTLPKEGKSLIASALARSLASSGVRTLLIDLNGRNVNYGSSLDMRHRSSVGLQDFLDGCADAGEAAAKVDPMTPLFLMSDNINKPTNISAVTGALVKSRLAALRKEFEAIVIDTPAMHGLSDALQVAGCADEIVLTALRDHACPAKLRDDIARLQARSARLKGVVLIDQDAPAATELARIAGYPQRHDLHEVWPKARRTRTLIARIFGRSSDRGACTHAEVSA